MSGGVKALVAVCGGLALLAAAHAPDPAGITVWSGKGGVSQGAGSPPTLRFDHISMMHFANGRTALTTMSGDRTYTFSGTLPADHDRRQPEFAADTLLLGRQDPGRPAQTVSAQITGDCSWTYKADLRTLVVINCDVQTPSGPLDMAFFADKTPADFKAFTPAAEPNLRGR